MEHWKTYKLSELCTKVTDGSHFSPSAQASGYPMLSVKDMLEFGFDYNKCKRISKEDFLIMRSNGCVPEEGDVLVAKDGSYLKQIFVCRETREEAILSSIAIFRPDRSKILPDYLCYLIKSPKVYDYISRNCVSGSALPRIVLKAFKDITLDVPPISVQDKVIATLKSIDDKIVLNTRINHNLEEQAKSLYQSWFVDFEPFRDGKFVDSELGMIPDGWAIKRIGELPLFIADYVANGSFASLKENVTLLEREDYAVFVRNTDLKSGSFGIYVNKASYDFLAKTRLYGGEIIVSNVGDVGSVHLCPELNSPMTLGNNVIMIRPADNCYLAFLYLNLKYFSVHYSIEGITGGSAMPKFNKTDFRSIKLLVPPESVLKRFACIENPLFTAVERSKQEGRELCAIRDTILPSLMNGTLLGKTINC